MSSTTRRPGTCPHLGAQFQPLAGEQLADPYPFYARARREEPVFYSPAFGMWFLTRYEDITAVLKDPSTFSSADTVPSPTRRSPEVQQVLAGWSPFQNLLNTDPPVHTRLRALANQGFSAKRIAVLEPVIRATADGLIDAFVADGRVELISQFSYPFPLTVILRVLGVPAQDMAACRRWTAETVTLDHAAGTLSPDLQVAYARGFLAFRRYTTDLVAQRQQAPREDLISHLLQESQNGREPLAADEVADLIVQLIIAGHETTANLIGSTMWRLLAHPERWQRVQDDPSLLKQVVEEGLRTDPPILGMIRTTTRKVQIGGIELPAGARLFLLYASANRDEAHFAHPEVFSLDRGREAPHLAFGRGIHFCPGAPLARLETRVAIECLARRLPSLHLVAGQSIEHVPSLVFRGPAQLHLAWDASSAE